MTFRRNNFADTMHGINELSHVGLRLYVYRDDEFSKAKCSLFPYLIPAGRSPSQ
ncbi:putative methionine aminopeptidase [Escherichia coli 2845350]|nr:putative methionine aminopeptidase [Escherichia coli 2845350]END61222.1 putative methionine aminopeptidase [Escherichia coli P0298942.3]